MAIRLYDDALATKINNWLPKDSNRTIKVLKPEEVQRLFEIEADEKNDKPLTLPLIAISRDTTVDLLTTTKQPMTFDGLMLESNSTTKKTLQLDAIPITINYQIDLYTKRYDEGDELLREFIFKIINNPQLVIELPYNGKKFKHVASIHLQNQVEDTSSISQRLFSGQFTRWTLKVDIVGAYLFSLPLVDNVELEFGLDVADNRRESFDYHEE